MEILKSIDTKEYKTILKIKKDSLKLHLVPPPIVLLNIAVFNKNKDIIKTYEDIAKSWTRNGYNLLCQQMAGVVSSFGGAYGAGGMYFKDTSNTNKFIASKKSWSGQTVDWSGAINTATQGIVIGIGVGAESFESYALGTQIAHGTAAGQMSYLAHIADATVYTAGTKLIENVIERTFNNDSGGSINVSEIGFYVATFYINGTAYSNGIIMIQRDLLGAAITVANGQSIRIRYKMQVTYPA